MENKSIQNVEHSGCQHKKLGRKAKYTTPEERKHAKQEQTNKSCLNYYKIHNIDPIELQNKKQQSLLDRIFKCVDKLTVINKHILSEYLAKEGIG